ncbi:hypothetical protein KY317_01180 [Candidatus Woesearchaeota archaeon]|nr:hypothetical protein [Candidatus Woesearchaeota archaeon]
MKEKKDLRNLINSLYSSNSDMTIGKDVNGQYVWRDDKIARLTILIRAMRYTSEYRFAGRFRQVNEACKLAEKAFSFEDHDDFFRWTDTI